MSQSSKASPTPKVLLRQEMRRLLSFPTLSLVGQIIVDRVRHLPQWQQAATVMLYAPLPDEPNLRPLFEPIPGQRRIVVPRMHDRSEGEMEAVEVVDAPPSGDHVAQPVPDWSRRRFGIWEPVGPAIDVATVDFALVPGLAFTRDGRRLGRGRGYYDRFLARLRPDCFKCGIGYDFQLVDDLPTEPHDVLLDAVVMPNGVYRRTEWLRAQ